MLDFDTCLFVAPWFWFQLPKLKVERFHISPLTSLHLSKTSPSRTHSRQVDLKFHNSAIEQLSNQHQRFNIAADGSAST